MAGLPTEPPGRPKVSPVAGDLRSDVSAGSETRAERDLGDRSIFNGSPAVTGNRILIRSDKHLYCLGE